MLLCSPLCVPRFRRGWIMTRNEPPEPNQKARRKRKAPNAPGQALGFSLQFTRLTQLLITAPEGSFVSFEVFEDVGLKTREGATHFIQTKSALTANPLTDRSVGLWKTLANWADGLSIRPCEPAKLKLVLYVSRPVDGEIARSFHQALPARPALANQP